MKASEGNVLDGEGPELGLFSLERNMVRADVYTVQSGNKRERGSKVEMGQTGGSDKKATFSRTF